MKPAVDSWWVVSNAADWARFATLIFASAALTIGAFRVRYWLRHASRSSMMMRLALAVFLSASLVSAWEALHLPVQPGIRAYLFAVACAWTLVALVFEAADSRCPRKLKARAIPGAGLSHTQGDAQ